MLSKVLKSLLEEVGINLTQLAKATKVPKANLHNWLQGGNPNMQQLIVVAKYFDVSLDFLLTGKESDPLEEILSDSFQIFSGKYEIIINRIIDKKKRR